MTTQSSHRVSSVWQAVVRCLTPEPAPISLSEFSSTLTSYFGSLNVFLLAISIVALLTGKGWPTQTPEDYRVALVASAACGALIALWAGVLANIKAASWAITALYTTAAAWLIYGMFVDPGLEVVAGILFLALSLAAAAPPLFRKKRQTE